MQEYDLRNTASIEESVRHSDVVYNLVGRDYPTKYGALKQLEGFVLIFLGTSILKMFMLKVQNG